MIKKKKQIENCILESTLFGSITPAKVMYVVKVRTNFCSKNIGGQSNSRFTRLL